ncbi:MAG: tyrosine-protein phosphatase [Clostridia bacterium]|nr:tyrosine-protein phosphatase [Clostridia bacterium]
MKTKFISIFSAASVVMTSYAAFTVTAFAEYSSDYRTDPIATYMQAGKDFTSETATDNVASLWNVTVTPGSYSISSISVKVKDKEGNVHTTDDVYELPVISQGDVVFGVVVNHPASDVDGITAVVDGSDIEAVADSRSLHLASVNNARELGGYAAEDGKRVKKGVLLRTAALGNASEEDIKKLRDDYHLGTVIDLRMTREVEASPDLEIEGVKNLNLRIIDEEALAEKSKTLTAEDMEGIDPTDPIGRLKIAIKLGIVGEDMYINFLSTDKGKKGYKEMFDELLELPEGKSLLFHCTQGKDRTGCAAMLILSALGVDENTIIKDFMLTNTYNADLIAVERRALMDAGYSGEELETIMSARDQVNQQYMEKAINWMKADYGSVVGYITQGLGVTHEQIQTLKDKFLE